MRSVLRTHTLKNKTRVSAIELRHAVEPVHVVVGRVWVSFQDTRNTPRFTDDIYEKAHAGGTALISDYPLRHGSTCQLSV